MAIKKKKKKNVKSSRQTASKSVRRNVREGDSSLVKAVGTIIALAFAIFVAISNFSLGGSVGSIVRAIVLSAFGTLGYAFPIIIIIAVIINLINDKSKANGKTYFLLAFYVAIICILECLIHDFDLEQNLSDAINSSIIRARNYFSFTKESFSGGVIGTALGYLLNEAIGKMGTIVLFSAIGLISFIALCGLGISKHIINIFKAIIFFIPNLIKRNDERREEDRQIAIDNENILRSTIEKSKKANMQVTFDKGFSSDRLVLEPIIEKKKTYDTSNIDITASDIQSRFYDASSGAAKSYERPQSRLLNEMKKKSINEILYEQKEKGNNSSEFFYTEGMKPIDDLDNIVIPQPQMGMSRKSEDFRNEFDSVDNDSIYSDREKDLKKFSSGLDELRNDKVIDESSVKKTLHNIEKNGVELKNNSLTDSELPKTPKKKRYKFPPTNLLYKSERKANEKDPKLNEKANILVETLKQFGVGTSLINITVGPAVTRYELKPDAGVKVSKILSLENDVQLALAASSLKLEAPIPGKAAIGIEIANEKSASVLLGDIISSSEFRNAESKLTVAIGKDISGKPVITDLRKMPHLLIAGATGSGKSVCVNSLITSLIYKSSPEDVRLIMVDPKVVELQIYDGIPHLLIPVVTNAKKAAGALNWAVSEMTRRYNLIQERRVRDIESYNQVIEGEISKIGVNDDNEADFEPVEKMPYIVIIIDEFADLMMVASKEVENAITRIAQLARACGIYLVIATQRPSVNVISGSIKTNVPSRISFAVASGVDSQTILDRRGAEKLLGHGDMLYFPVGYPEPIRVQGAYVSDEEIINIVNYIKGDTSPYDIKAETAIEKGVSVDGNQSEADSNEKDEKFIDAGRLIVEQQNASIGMIQRRFAMGFNRAARIIDQLEAEGVISKQDGKKPREVLMTVEEFDEKFGG